MQQMFGVWSFREGETKKRETRETMARETVILLVVWMFRLVRTSSDDVDAGKVRGGSTYVV